MASTTPDRPAADDPADIPAAESAADQVSAAEAADDPDAELPLNRAARRSRGKEKAQNPLVPGHVGPQALRGRSGNAPRSHTKRRSV